MRPWIRSHLTYANVMVTILAFVVLGGTAAAATYVVSSNSQIGPGTISGHNTPTGKHANIIAGSINGADIADRSGVDTCEEPLVKKFGPICAGSDGGARDWQGALEFCVGYGLRLPSLSEALALAEYYDVPGVGNYQGFWTDSPYMNNTPLLVAFSVTEDAHYFAENTSYKNQTVCVTDPSA